MEEINSDATIRKVIEAIASTKRIAPESITLDTTLEDLQIDSLDGLNLFFELEEAFDISIPDNKARSMRSVRQIVDELTQMLSAKAESDSGGAVRP